MPQFTEPIIRLDKACIKFGDQTIHRDISLTVYPGESITILGPSGIGKTLILKMIMGLLTPSSGDIFVFNTHLSHVPEVEKVAVRRRVGMLFQGAALFDSLTVFENIAYPLRQTDGNLEDQIRQTVEEKLALVGLPGIGNKLPHELSGGQRKRVGLARALASAPEVVLFDEPTTGLDPTATRLIDELVLKLNQELGITTIAVTHDIESAKRISRRWILINNGTIVADGPAAEVANSNAQVQEFITGNWKQELQCV